MKSTHKFVWGNNPKRETLKNRLCRIIARGAKGSVIVEFENGQRECVSLRALRNLSYLTNPKERQDET
jgi:hypothetical protein